MEDDSIAAVQGAPEGRRARLWLASRPRSSPRNTITQRQQQTNINTIMETQTHPLLTLLERDQCDYQTKLSNEPIEVMPETFELQDISPWCFKLAVQLLRRLTPRGKADLVRKHGAAILHPHAMTAVVELLLLEALVANHGAVGLFPRPSGDVLQAARDATLISDFKR